LTKNSTKFQITVSPDSRNTAWVSFDGRKRQELEHGDRYVSFFKKIRQNVKPRDFLKIFRQNMKPQELIP